MMGVTPCDFAIFAAAQGADFIGANCGIGPAELLYSVQGILTQANEIPVVAKGNCSIPAVIDVAMLVAPIAYVLHTRAVYARSSVETGLNQSFGSLPTEHA